MSGFEIVGVVLGGLPLAIKAAENYKQGLEPLVKWNRYKLEFRAFVHDVDIETQMFEALVDRLLQYTDLSVEQKEMLLKGKDLDGWCHAETEKALRQRLGNSFDACKNLLKMLENDLIKLQAMLSLKDGSVDWARPGEDKWNYQRKRIAHSFSKKGPETIASLSKNIKRFRDLLDVLDERIGTAGKQEQRKIVSNDTTWAKIFECIRTQALSLHAALKNGWKCTCEVPHLTSLQLQRRTTGEWSSQFVLTFLPPKDSSKTWDRRRFTVAVKESKAKEMTVAIRPSPTPVQEGYLNKLKSNVELSTPEKEQLSFYKESDFRSKSSPSSNSSFSSLRKALRSSPNVANSGVACPPTSPGLNCPTAPTKLKPRKKVGWSTAPSNGLQVPVVQHSQSTPNLLPVDSPTPITIVQPEQILEITDLCTTLAKYDPNTTCIGYLSCPEKHHHEFRSLKNPHDPSSPTQELVSLEQLLNRSHKNHLKLTRKQQYRLTVILASSLLQLQTTPWMTGKLEKKDIFFEYSGFEVFAEQPYISHAFPYVAPPAPSTPSALRFATRASLVQLGILLLELCFGASIESQVQLRTPYLVNGLPHNDTDFLTARDWISDVEQEGGPGFQEAIRCCFNLDGKPDWGDAKFMQGVYDGVVRPLEGVLGDNGWGEGLC